MESTTESEELARKGARPDGAGEKCEEEDSTRPVFDGLTCSGLDTGMEIEDFINETVEEGKSEKLVLEEQTKTSAPEGNLEESPRTTTTTTMAAEAGEEAAAHSSEIVAEKTKTATEVVVVEHEDAIQQVGKIEEKKGLESSTVAANVEEPRKKLAITTTAGENEETIDGAALSSIQQVDGSNTTLARDQGDKTDATKNSEPELVEAVPPKENAKAPKSCVVNMASDDNPRGKKENPGKAGATKSNGSAARSKKNQVDQTSSPTAVEGEAAVAKTPAKRGRKPGSKRADKAATESSPKSRSSSGELMKVPQVTLDLTTQPFSDAQQIQLRAQILVYGAIIQGSLADESLMGAAFTDISKVRNLESFESQAGASKVLWEKTWRAASERVSKASTPKLGGRNSPPALRRPLSPGNLPKSPSSKGKKTSATPSSSTATTTTTSALTTTTTNSDLPSVSPIATSVMNMASATVASWNSARARAPPPPMSWSSFPFNVPAGVPSQFPSPLRGSWGVFSQGPFAAQAPFGSQPPAFPLFSSPPQAVTPPPPPPAGSPSPVEDERSKGKRKRLEQEATPAPSAPTQAAIANDISPATAGLLEDHRHEIVGPEELQKLRGEELVQRLESAKNKAEEAASAASSMVEHSQTVWDEIKEKRRSKSISSREAQLASSLAAASAAASVAKAAAAAATVAYAAALQARAMASEIVGKEAENDSDPTVTHVTQGDEGAATQVKAAIAGAKVAIKDRADVAALALKRAENLDAVVRAAELAAQAASQAGEVMAIGDPASLASCEKSPKPAQARASGKRNARSKPAAKKKSKSAVAADEQGALAKDHNEEVSVEAEANQGNEEVLLAAAKGDEGGATNSTKSGAAQGDVVDAEPLEGLVEDKQHGKGDEIVVGAHVEIVPDEDGLQGVWFSAKVKALNGDDAFVVYDDLLDDDGNGNLEEWVNITSRIENVPRVRMAHPMTKDGGMRKRRRAAQGSQKCYVDDHVDVWMRDGWWEGIVQSVDEDETHVTVFFPGDGDTELTKSWNLRPSLVWHNDAWVLWRDTLGQSKKQKTEDGGGNTSSQELETPGKRKKPDATTASETPKTSVRSGAKPTKRRKFSDVIEKDQEARDATLAKQQTPPPAASKKPPPTPKAKPKKPVAKPTAPKKSSPPKKAKEKEKQSKSNDDGEVRKSGRMIHPTSKMLEGLETTPKVVTKKNGSQQSAS